MNYLLVILITLAGTWYFISNDKNKLVSASEKSIESVVTISSENMPFANNKSGIGSGVIFSNDGYIVTNLHILSGKNINVKINDGESYPASVIGIDKNTDIAILKISSKEKLKSISFADSDNLKIGDRVLGNWKPIWELVYQYLTELLVQLEEIMEIHIYINSNRCCYQSRKLRWRSC